MNLMPPVYARSYESLASQYAGVGVRPGGQPRTAAEHLRRRALLGRERALRRAAAAAAYAAAGYDLRPDAFNLLLVLADQMVLQPVAAGADPAVLEGVLANLPADVRVVLGRARASGAAAGPLSGHAVVDGVLAAWADLHLASVRVWGPEFDDGPGYGQVYARLSRRYVELGPAVGGLWRGQRAARQLRGHRENCWEAVTLAEGRAGVTLRADAKHLSLVALDQLVLLPVYLAGRPAMTGRILAGLAQDLTAVYREAAGVGGRGLAVSGHAVLTGVSRSWARLGFASFQVWG